LIDLTECDDDNDVLCELESWLQLNDDRVLARRSARAASHV